MKTPFSALAEPRREQILRLVWSRELTAGQIAERFPITFGAVSQHLAVLLQTNLVTVRQLGRERWYAANRPALGPFAEALERFWADRLGELKALAEAEQKAIDGARPSSAAPTRQPARPRKPVRKRGSDASR